MRVVAVLGPDQSLTLSTPHEAGTPPDAVEIIRRATRRPRRSRTERGFWRRAGAGKDHDRIVLKSEPLTFRRRRNLQ